MFKGEVYKYYTNKVVIIKVIIKFNKARKTNTIYILG
jgi:hypothetical protein